MVATGHLLRGSLTDEGFQPTARVFAGLSQVGHLLLFCLYQRWRLKARLAYSCLKWRIYCEVCLINCFLLRQGGPDGEGKGPVHILLLSPLLPFAPICHQRVLQYPRCLILLLTQGSASTGGLATLRRRYETEFRTSLKMVEPGSRFA